MAVVDDVVIRTEQLTKVYPGGLKAVDELDLEVHQGEIFGLLGPNGAGKTTTAGMLTTRVIPTSGRASVGGIDVVAHPTAAKQVIGVVPQSNTLDRSLTVWENLYFHGRFFGMSANWFSDNWIGTMLSPKAGVIVQELRPLICKPVAKPQ